MYNKMTANILPLHSPLTPGVGSKGQFFLSENSHVAHQVNRNETENTMQANILPFYTPSSPGWGQKVLTIFILKVIVAYQIKWKEV